ncbi:hypothetical protein M3Y99_01240400 [Aphelenchoides fujianensis]|nr:hypothetical protein M3Y99_01240400 [Aphelenchoides fujianensis]
MSSADPNLAAVAVTATHTPLHPVDTRVQNARVNEPVPSWQVLALRGTIVGAGVLGVALVIRNSKLFSRLRHVKEIPETFIRKEVQLKGVIRALEPNGVIKVEHEPIIGLPSIFRPKKRAVDLLRIRLAGVNVSKAGVEYLAKDLKLKDRKIFFHVVKPTAGDSDTVDADVTVKKSLVGATNLNVDLIRKGFARVHTLDDQAHYKSLQDNAAYSRLVHRLLTSEKVAEKRAIGVWEQNTWVEQLQSYPTALGQMARSSAITKFFFLLGRIVYDLSVLVVEVARQVYFFGQATGNFALAGYRAFGRRVDQLTHFYDRQRVRFQRKTLPAAPKKE